MPMLDEKLMMVWECEGGAMPRHATRDEPRRDGRNDSAAADAVPAGRDGAGRRGSARRPDGGRPVAREVRPYSEAFVTVARLFHDPAGAGRARDALQAARPPIAGANVRTVPVGLVQDLTPPGAYEPRRGFWRRVKCRLLGSAGPGRRAAGRLPPDARVVSVVAAEARADRVAALLERHGGIGMRPHIKWSPRVPRPVAGRGTRRTARGR